MQIEFVKSFNIALDKTRFHKIKAILLIKSFAVWANNFNVF